MINKKRVRRIKNLIYAFIIIAMFLPLISLILVSLLSFRMNSLEKKVSEKLDGFLPSVSQTTAPSPDDDGYVIEPEDETTKNENFSPNTTEEKSVNDMKSDQVLSASGEQPEASGILPDITPTDGTADSGAGDGSANIGENPISGSDIPPQTSYNGNPLTGC